jgi:hypothetical protein
MVDKPAPAIESRVWIFGGSAAVGEQKIGIDIAARHKSRVARSRPGSVVTSQSPRRMLSISSFVALPATPASAAQRSFCEVPPERRNREPGSTPSASANRPIVSRSTRVARPVRMFRAVLIGRMWGPYWDDFRTALFELNSGDLRRRRRRTEPTERPRSNQLRPKCRPRAIKLVE